MILITGFPYVRKNFAETFDYYPEPEDIFFLLPRIWKVKKGKVIYRPDHKKNITTTAAYFHHSRYPIIGGLLKGWMPLFPWFAWQFKRKGGTLVYACSEPNLLSTFYFNIWSRICGLTVVNFTWENIDPRQKFGGIGGWLQILLLKLNLLLAHGIVCGNEKAQKIIDDIIHKPTAHIPMNGLNSHFFQKQHVKKEFGGVNLEGSVVFTFMGAIGFRKGLNTMMEAFAIVHAHISNAILLVIGSGEYEAELENKISELKLHGQVIRTPWVDHEEAKRVLSLSDVFLYPSISFGGWEEQFGYSMAEASLMELPVIATRSGSIHEVVVNEKTGILIQPEDSQALASAMMRLGEDERLRHDMGVRGREFIVRNFTHAVIAQKFKDFFKSL